ncbi:hypothetical protein [Aliisedimentitalea sp. MJ-SS2]|uniref:hypothetical protein n=1 Tax=Aliisedimentitalea sp. MJ-SS2 TaxID=3049795 RepID=UPI00292FAF0A|nr:hypothetical protein [Alisedimentitalea sp. MJ-SS2]
MRGIPFAGRTLQWISKRQRERAGPISLLHSEIMIPDPSRPLPPDRRGPLGPTHELILFEPPIVTADVVVGREITDVSVGLGTYGMGGYGYFGLKLDEEWLVIAVGGAGDWIEIDGRMVEDHFAEENGRPKPWVYDDEDELRSHLRAKKVAGFEVTPRSLRIGLDNGSKIEIKEDAAARHPYPGNGEPRRFLPEDDLRRAVFLSPTDEIW